MATRSVRAVPQKQRRSGLTRLAGREEPKTESPKAEQIAAPDLQASNELEKLPPAIKNGRTAVNYLKPHFEHDQKSDSRTVGLELSLELRDEHKEVIPKEIKTWWDLLKAGGVKSMALLGIPMQFVELGLTPEFGAHDLEIKAAPIQKVSLAVVPIAGDPDAGEVIRLTFRVMVELDAEIEKFACRHFGKTMWLRMVPVQGTLL